MTAMAAVSATQVSDSGGVLEQDPDLLAKLATLRNQVVTAVHPRIRLPQAALQAIASTAGLGVPTQDDAAASARKADELIRADVALRRQGAETLLRQGADSVRPLLLQLGKRSGKDRDEDCLAGPNDFSVADTWSRVLDREAAVAAAPVEDPDRRASLGSSVDENSYYSSKAPDSWSGRSEEGELVSDGPAAAANLVRDESYSPPPPDPTTDPHGLDSRTSHTAAYNALSEGDRDSDSYSPPSPPMRNGKNVPTGPRVGKNFGRNGAGNHHNQHAQGKFQSRKQRKGGDPTQREQQGRGPGHASSSLNNTRKRQREDDDVSVSGLRHVSGAHETYLSARGAPYIKPEPTSPLSIQPPGAGAPPPQLQLMPPPPPPPPQVVTRQEGPRLHVHEDGRVELIEEPQHHQHSVQYSRDAYAVEPHQPASHENSRPYQYAIREPDGTLRPVRFQMSFLGSSASSLTQDTGSTGRRRSRSEGASVDGDAAAAASSAAGYYTICHHGQWYALRIDAALGPSASVHGGRGDAEQRVSRGRLRAARH